MPTKYIPIEQLRRRGAPLSPRITGIRIHVIRKRGSLHEMELEVEGYKNTDPKIAEALLDWFQKTIQGINLDIN